MYCIFIRIYYLSIGYSLIYRVTDCVWAILTFHRSNYMANPFTYQLKCVLFKFIYLLYLIYYLFYY